MACAEHHATTRRQGPFYILPDTATLFTTAVQPPATKRARRPIVRGTGIWLITITTNPPPQHGGFGVPGFMHVTPDRPKNGDAIHSARTLAGLIAPHPANYSRPACLFFCVWICFCSRSGFILCEFGYLFSVSPAYQHVCLPKHRLNALWIHINKLLLLSRQLHSRLGVYWNSPLGLER